MALIFRRILTAAAVVALLGIIGRMDYADQQFDRKRTAELRARLKPHHVASPNSLCFAPAAVIAASTRYGTAIFLRSMEGRRMPCESCKGNRYCALKNALARRIFFAMAKGELVTCSHYDQQWFRGIEGVAA